MPLIVDGGLISTRWAEKKEMRPALLPQGQDFDANCLRIAFINNMPDPALEDTEMQFCDLLDAAAVDVQVLLKLYYLPEVPRGVRAQQHINKFYFDIKDLWNSAFDGVIITGTEPKQRNLREEPYWGTLASVLDWAQRNTSSAVLSCLAAHASVLHNDGIGRHALADKQFGVFDYGKPCTHPLTNGTSSVVSIPHSRWNEVREDELRACGYLTLTKSAETGVDLFVKGMGKSLFVHFQGHPEYGTHTLMKEYRRDIRRYLTRERETYPSMPHGYFEPESAKRLNEFRETSLLHRDEKLLAVFPAEVVETVKNTWHSSANRLYCNWLQYLELKKTRIVSRGMIATAPGDGIGDRESSLRSRAKGAI